MGNNKLCKNYEPPQAEVIEVQIEKGFATSGENGEWKEGNL